MKKFILIIVLIQILTSCTSEFGKFNEKALTFATNDNKINEKEYQELLKQILASNEDGFKQFKNEKGEFEDSKVVSYLLKYYKAKNVSITENDIWQPKLNTVQNTFNINVFLENSASMDGYVKGVTDFENSIYNLLGDFKISGICDSLNLNYINSKPIPFPPDVQDFIQKLEPSTFENRGGDRSVSDLKNIMSTVLKKVNKKNAVVLISDFVFSPGKNENAQDYLNNQEVGIKIDFAEKLRKFDLSTVIVQMQSNFDGEYYDKTNKIISYKGKRPYYVLIFGSSEQIKSILDKKILDNIKGGYLNRLVLQKNKEIIEPNFKILYSPKIGSFSAKQLQNKIISEATPSKDNKNKGVFGFSLAVDFSNSLNDDKYYLDTSNYKINDNKYKLNIETINGMSNSSLSGYTHILNLQTNDLIEEAIKIDVIGKTPNWVKESSSNNDSNILTDIEEQQKTFGLTFLINGLTYAFYPKSDNIQNSMTINIQKPNSSLSWGWIFLVLLVLITIIILVIRKNNN